jgi:hypothetical protein
MKPRRVFVTLELESTLPLSTLRNVPFWSFRAYEGTKVFQAQVNVAGKLWTKAGAEYLAKAKCRRPASVARMRVRARS